MSDSDDIGQDPERAAEEVAATAQTSQDRGDAGGGFGGGEGSEEAAQPGGRGRLTAPDEPLPKDTYASASPTDMDLQAGASSGGSTGHDRRGGFATDPQEAAGLMPDPERPDATASASDSAQDHREPDQEPSEDG